MMKKSKIVSYTSEELKQMHGQSDWEANAAMTDEEIEAAIASDPEEAEMHKGWMQRGIVVRHRARFVMCIDNKGHEASLTRRRVYKVIPDEKADQHKMIRLLDDSGQDTLFPGTYFVPVQLPIEAEQNFEAVVA